MAEKIEPSEVPTYYANFVTMQLNADEMVIEFRSHRPAHTLVAGSDAIVDVPAPNPTEVFGVDPVARVVVTFSSAAAMKSFLDDALPVALGNRKK
jgi:hypothetical protein